MEKGIKHLVKCRCVLPQFKGQPDPPDHQFVVFSVLDDQDALIPKFAQCNNCGIIHKVTDVCKSEIMPGREQMSSIMSLEDIKSGISEQLVALLETNDVDRATWEQVRWIVDNQRWGDTVIIASEFADGLRQGKFVRIIGEKLFKIDTFVREEFIDIGDK